MGHLEAEQREKKEERELVKKKEMDRRDGIKIPPPKINLCLQLLWGQHTQINS